MENYWLSDMGCDVELTGNVTAFLREFRGIYQYKRSVKRIASWAFWLLLICYPIAAYKFFSDPPASSLETIRGFIGTFGGPYFLWALWSLNRKFDKIQIDETGIYVLPLGLSLAAEQIQEVHHEGQQPGKGPLKLKLKSAHFVFHIMAFSIGYNLTIGFNKRVLERLETAS